MHKNYFLRQKKKKYKHISSDIYLTIYRALSCEHSRSFTLAILSLHLKICWYKTILWGVYGLILLIFNHSSSYLVKPSTFCFYVPYKRTDPDFVIFKQAQKLDFWFYLFSRHWGLLAELSPYLQQIYCSLRVFCWLKWRKMSVMAPKINVW